MSKERSIAGELTLHLLGREGNRFPVLLVPLIIQSSCLGIRHTPSNSSQAVHACTDTAWANIDAVALLAGRNNPRSPSCQCSGLLPRLLLLVLAQSDVVCPREFEATKLTCELPLRGINAQTATRSL